jgi:hypothetical protein
MTTARLRFAKGALDPVEMLVINRAEKPSEN